MLKNRHEVMESDLSKREKIDELLRIDCKMYTNLGTDSTAKEKAAVKAESLLIYKTIQKLCPVQGDLLVRAADE